MRPWQILALISGAIITPVMALASISYNATLGSGDLAFAGLPITNKMLFSSLALAFDLGMIASVFGFLHWRVRNRTAALICVILFAIASVYSVHSVRGYIALNVTKALAPHERHKDVYASLKTELASVQVHIAGLRASLLKARGRKRKRLAREIKQQDQVIRDARSRLVEAKSGQHVPPLQGLEWFLALSLWFFHATCWSAWFGGAHIRRSSSKLELRAPYRDHDGISAWLSSYQQNEPEHCTRLYERYCTWCDCHDMKALSSRKFYAQLVAHGAHKFRDGRNGPMKYALPQTLSVNGKIWA